MSLSGSQVFLRCGRTVGNIPCAPTRNLRLFTSADGHLHGAAIKTNQSLSTTAIPRSSQVNSRQRALSALYVRTIQPTAAIIQRNSLTSAVTCCRNTRVSERYSGTTDLITRSFNTSSTLMKYRKKKRHLKRRDAVTQTDAEDEEDYDVDVTSPEEEKERIIHLVQERLTQEVEKEDRISGTLSYRPNIVKVINVLQKHKFPSNRIINIASDFEVLEASTVKLGELINMFLAAGFSCKQIGKILVYSGEVVEVSAETLDAVFNTVRQLVESSDKMVSVLTMNPELLFTPAKNILHTHNKLSELFTRTELVGLIVRVPDVLTSSWSDVQRKYDYVTEVMGVDVKQVATTGVLQHEYLHLVARHKFLERAGLYERPNKQGNTSVENASLRHVVALDDEEFAALLAGMRVQEYITFRRMLEQDQEEAEVDELSEDEEGERDEMESARNAPKY